MRNQEETYSNTRVFESSSESQNPVIHEEIQGPREVGQKVLQNRQELQKNQNNINQRYSTMQNNSCLNETLRNKPTECDGFKSQEEQISGETNINRERPNRFCGENKIVLECKQHTGKCVEAQWFCCGIKCYFFIMDDKQWTGCKQTCEACSLSLLKIHDYDELKFLKPRLTTNSYWIGLSYNKSKRKWQWVGGGTSKLDLMTMNSLKKSGECAFLRFGGIQSEDCGVRHPCVCEKRMDKFPDLLYTMKEK